MAESLLVIGRSGTGKSTSVRALNPNETFVINVAKKQLPFKGSKTLYTDFILGEDKKSSTGNLFNTDNPKNIQGALKHINEFRPDIKNIVIDDMQYVMTNEYMRRSKEKGFDKFVEMSSNMFNTISMLNELRGDLMIVCMFHPDVDTDETGNRMIQAKTIGKMFDKYVTLEGLFAIVLYTFSRRGESKMEYGFTTQNSGQNTGKSPEGMFEAEEIPNDLQLVRDMIWAYNYAT
ncbi:AAA family ATPase [Spirosoma terrae]|uniref:AAA family ATPase n=1 Tax=Spirosoma terrae TaxID=1968276 RepID=A0A6L9L588_9BACT|nr:AAA family ATPase [Spirosoma terrae]NDU95654.1 AAA family ATPase [Spirosoma terrae]